LLHLGSLVAAVGSFLDARHHGGLWLVRMEDLDRQRCLPGSADEILRSLEAFGLLWDGEVLHQSQRSGRYADALALLDSRGLTFECSCSRRELAAGEMSPYPGTCRAGHPRPPPTATRFRVDPGVIAFVDRLQGPQTFDQASLGDVVIRRRDGVIAYQLAVVVDDADQGVSDVVRGADLLASTGWQIALQHALGLPSPRYMHLPLIVDSKHGKLSKSRGSLALDRTLPGEQLVRALCLLRLPPPRELRGAPAATLLDWAVQRWPPAALHGVPQIAVPGPQERRPPAGCTAPTPTRPTG
jgi:glutamyl-Q tRNA(Asp) synthetase